MSLRPGFGGVVTATAGARQLPGVSDDGVVKQEVGLCCADALAVITIAARKIAPRILSGFPSLESRRDPLRIPGMAFAARLAQPRVQRIVDDEPMPQLHMVVLEESREPERNRQQSGALGFRLELIGIGTANYARKLPERGISQLILVNERIEAAAWTDVG